MLRGDNYVLSLPDLLENKFYSKKRRYSTILKESDLNLKSINIKIKSLLNETRNEIKLKVHKRVKLIPRIL